MPRAPTESSEYLKASRKPAKKSNFACENCRVRKRRCDGGQPRCKLCSQTDTECFYKRLPSRKYIEDLEQQCEELQVFVDKLRASNQDERLRLLATLNPKPEPGDEDDRHARAASSSKSVNTEDPADQLAGDFAERAKISSDGENRLSLHGPSSLFYLTPLKDEPVLNDQTETTFTQALDLEHRLLIEWLDTMTSQADLPMLSNEVWNYMLRMHFVWIQPLFGFVYRPAFLRDMHLSRGTKSMFSPFLIYSLSAHVVRYQDLVLLAGKDKPVEDPFLRHARLLVFPEVEKGSKLSSIHGLLLLAAKECSLGRVSQAWIYLGIAVRMVQDLGIHLDGRESEDQSKFDADELNNRQYSFWSAFTWDKMISMYCGRVPMLQLSKYSPSQNFDDVEAENEMWQPVGNGLDGFPYFEPTPAYGVSSFSQLCGLARVINSILLYDAGEVNAPKLDDIRKQLVDWRTRMPSYLRLDAAKGFSKIPPAHIINVNCLYHMISCLVDRRIQPGAPRASAVTSAMEISVLAQLSHKHFRDRQAVLSHCYCIYIAATVFLYRLRYRRSSLWLTEEETIVYNSLQWCLGRLRDVTITIQALTIPVKVLHEHLESIQGSFQVPTGGDRPSYWASTDTVPAPVLSAMSPSQGQPDLGSSWSAPAILHHSPASGTDQQQHDDQQQAPAQHIDPGLVFTQEFWNWLGGGELGTMPAETA